MADIKWLEGNRIQIAPPKRTKKITGTRFATILGLNPWSTAFEMWCAITKTYEKPFEDTIYTVAGKTIEPKQARYMEQSYGMDIVRPSDVWGEDYFNKTWGDFFPESKHLGGMWDYLMKGEDGKTIEAVLEMKTTKRAEDWQNDVPEYYALQAALYAYLYGVDDVIMVASFLDEKDYKDPAAYQPTASNTITVLNERGVNRVLGKDTVLWSVLSADSINKLMKAYKFQLFATDQFYDRLNRLGKDFRYVLKKDMKLYSPKELVLAHKDICELDYTFVKDIFELSYPNKRTAQKTASRLKMELQDRITFSEGLIEELRSLKQLLLSM